MSVRSFVLRIYAFLAVCAITHTACKSYSSDTSIIQDVIQAKEFKLTENEIVLRSGPGEQFEKIINKKASQVMDKIQYAKVDRSVTVVVDEAGEQWSKIRVVKPDWLSASHIGWIQTKYLVESGAVPEPAPVARKLGIFNDIDLLRSKLSENGIGSLCEWRSDEVGGYMSITYYYRFGEPSAKNGMDNNLAYYLESKNKNYVETVSLVLNINNSAAEREAIDRFIQVAKKTFRAIGVDMPKGLVGAIEKKEEFMAEKDLFRTKLLLEESKKETLKLMIFAQ